MPRSASNSFSASTAVVATTPVRSLMRSHSRRSASKPSQPDEVPLQPMTSTLASASNSAAARILLSSNCANARLSSAISVTWKREKCALALGTSAVIALVSGSSAVLDEGVRTPRRMVCFMVIRSSG